jgi:hypothetical protein
MGTEIFYAGKQTNTAKLIAVVRHYFKKAPKNTRENVY